MFAHIDRRLEKAVVCDSDLRMNPLDMRVQVPSLGEGGWTEHAEVRLLARVSCHVSLQHHLLVECLAAVRALEGPLACERERERER